MTENPKRLLVDSPLKEVCDELFFLKPEDIKIWMANEDFKNEYKRLYDEGEQDGFYLFLVAAGNVYNRMKDARENDPGSCVGFDFKMASKSMTRMNARFKQGFDNRALDPKLKDLIGRICAPKSALKYWLMVPEFSAEIEKLKRCGFWITNKSVYKAMRKVFNENLNRVIQSGDNPDPKVFNFRAAKQAMRYLEKYLDIPQDQRVSAAALAEIREKNKKSDQESIPEPDQVSDSK